MSEQELSRICKWVRGGAQLFIGSDPMGRRKIKIVRGPFGFLTKRYSCSDGEVEKLRGMLKMDYADAA
jgi:hypothetical protein